MRKFYMFTCLLILVAVVVQAQNFYSIKRTRNLLLSFGVGTANYKGELVNPGELAFIRPNIAFGAEYYLSRRISLRPELTLFQLSGSDSKANDDRDERNLHFRSDNIEFSMLGTFNLSPQRQRFYQRSQLNFHAFAGIGVLRFNPKAEYQGAWIALQPLETEGVKYSRIIPVIPFGLGARIKFGPFFNLLLEGGYRITFSDYLDDASSTRYPDPESLKSDLSRALSDRRAEIGTKPSNYLVGKRGHPGQNDGYLIANVTLQYYMPREIFRNRAYKPKPPSRFRPKARPDSKPIRKKYYRIPEPAPDKENTSPRVP
jgi:hypothetical protein